jgi:ABC-2 type transport system ATP-binding protein
MIQVNESTHLLTLTDIRKSYSEFTLNSVSLNVPKGYIIGLIGPNGAGKSTTIKIIMNLIHADSSQVDVFGLSHATHEKEIKNRIAYVGEQEYFYDNKTVDWTGRFVAQYYTRWDENRFGDLLSQFKISRTKKVKDLSKGMGVKLALAIALSHHTEPIVRDEPTSGLDPIVRREVLDMIMSLTENENKFVVEWEQHKPL